MPQPTCPQCCADHDSATATSSSPVTGAWADFMSASAAAPDLDCLIAAHEKFLSVVLARALLGPGKAEGLRRTLTELLRTCMGLAPLIHRFNEKVRPT